MHLYKQVEVESDASAILFVFPETNKQKILHKYPNSTLKNKKA